MSLFSRFDSIISFFFYKSYLKYLDRNVRIDPSRAVTYPFNREKPSPFDIPFPLYTHRESSMVSSKHFLPLYSTSSITNQFRGYSGIGSLPVPVPPPCSTLWRTTFSCHAKSREMDWKRFLSSIERNTKTIIVKYISDRFSNKRAES